MRSADLTVQVSTKLNRSHVVHGREALILPDARPHRARPHRRPASSASPSRTRWARCTPRAGRSSPASPHLRSEVDIVCAARRGDASATGTASRGPAFRDRLHRIRDAHRPRGPRASTAYDEKVDRPGGFVLPHPPRDARDVPDRRRARRVFTVSPLDVLHVPEGRLLLQTLRCHDQFNTTIYGLDDRYRGIYGRPPRGVRAPRRPRRRSASPTATIVDLVSEWTDGSERTAPAFRVVAYDQPARLRRGVLPRDQRAGAAGLHGDAAATARPRSRSSSGSTPTVTARPAAPAAGESRERTRATRHVPSRPT